jgi:hypothetical protein
MFQTDQPTAATSLPTPAAPGTQGFFTQGNPGTGVPATILDADFMNMLMMELTNVVTAGGLTPSKTTYTQVVSAIKALIAQPQTNLVSGVVGQARNLVMNVAAASATATLTADEIVVETALGGLRYCLASFNKTINLATTGAGGMDTGTATANGWLGVYAIYNPTTQTAALLGTMEGGSALPMIYGGANMPAGYTASARLAVVPISGTAGQFASFSVQDNKCTIAEFTFITSSTSSSTAGNSALTSVGIPKSARRMSGSISLSNSAAMNSLWKFFADANSTGTKQFSVNTISGGGGNLFGYTSVPLSAPQTLRATAFVQSGTGTLGYILLAAEYEI